MKLASQRREQDVIFDGASDAEAFKQCCLYMVIRDMYVVDQ